MGQDFKKLIAWSKAMDLVVDVYDATSTFPQQEVYGLTAQIRRAAVSIPSNIAEGQARYSKKDFQHFLRQAKGSAAELQTQILIAKRLRYLNEKIADRLEAVVEELMRILNGLINSLDEATARGAGH
jgi:four helix bundle protein